MARVDTSAFRDLNRPTTAVGIIVKRELGTLPESLLPQKKKRFSKNPNVGDTLPKTLLDSFIDTLYLSRQERAHHCCHQVAVSVSCSRILNATRSPWGSMV